MDLSGFVLGAALGLGLLAVSAALAFLISLNPPIALLVLAFGFVLYCGVCGATQ